MSEDFPFEVGDKITWGDGHLLITAIGQHFFLAFTRSPHQSVYEDRYSQQVAGGWVRYVEPAPFPEGFWLVHRGFIDSKRSPFDSLADARADACGSCIGVLHLRSDGTTEMLNPNPERSTTP